MRVDSADDVRSRTIVTRKGGVLPWMFLLRKHDTKQTLNDYKVVVQEPLI